MQLPNYRRVIALLVIVGATLSYCTSVVEAGRRQGGSTALDKRASVFADFGCRGPAKRPHTIVLTCADAGLIVEKIHWSSWGGRVARGRGTVEYNDCDPFCAAGHFHRVPGARLHMTRIRYCPNTGHDQYHHLTIRSRAFKNRKHLYKRTVGCHTFGAQRLSASARRIYFFKYVGVEQVPRTRPSQITFDADGNDTVTGLHWHGWGGPRATARGINHINNCRPNCAQGHVSRVAVHVRLSRRGVFQHRRMYRCYRVRSAKGTGPRGCLSGSGSTSGGAAASGGSDATARPAAACAAPSDVYTAYRLRTKHASCRLAREVVRHWNRRSSDCGTGTDPGGPTYNTCRVRASGIRFFCKTRYAYAQVSKTTCATRHRIVKFRYDPS